MGDVVSSWPLGRAVRSPGPGAVLVLAVLAWLVLTLGGCAGASKPPDAPAPANRAAEATGELAARTTAQTEFGLLAGGDYAQAWDLWSAAAQHMITRADFISLNTLCPVGLGVAATVTAALPISSTEVLIQWQRPALSEGDQPGSTGLGSGRTGRIRMIYVGGVWRFEPADADLHGGVQAQLARRRAAHQCPRLGARKVT
jgi:hypothetical protein